MDFESSQDVVTSLGDKAVAKSQLSFVTLSVLGIMAGFFIALGYVSFIRISGTVPKSWGSFSTFLGGCLFPIGLIALTFVGGELATGNMMVMTLGLLQKKINGQSLAYNWLVVLITNCIGGILVAYLFGHIVGLTEGAFLEKTLSVAKAKIADPPLVAFVSGIGCNIFVCLAVYLGAMGKTYLGKMFGLWFPVMVFVVCGFQHVVANAFIIPAAIFSNVSGIQWSDYLMNTVFVFLGNAVGGSLFLAVPLMFVTAEKKEASEPDGIYEKY
ncbi:formate/nitrite transporter family protein [Enterococcus caccae]|uniref:Formate/nitrite transporter n=1 Tax=Enterococcus caccae ATCC BAA-1240 TaxID=1158612 RepID=R3WX77_9ENTE|nr:formate/nitrite transporter family protein [Enterococcus caccae]EOL46380.1 formate/nitrite transporter [Enterococcus caccae ATCC BAA-1240]EOT60749.1 formate/nitrite transporter [Enterococcus caccae ATCC BAA-1240]OJG27441.1 formate/nitrite transporter [Enterococcus caccae]